LACPLYDTLYRIYSEIIMTDADKLAHLLAEADLPETLELPPRFDEALGHVRGCLQAGEREGIRRDAMLSALMAELTPRLLLAYGPTRAAFLLRQTAAVMDTDSGSTAH
jgi:hypothetical protein